MRKITIFGNWKMNKGREEAILLAKRLSQALSDLSNNTLCGICPPYLFISDVAKIFEAVPLAVGAQNLYYERSGAYTGEVSAEMLLSAGARYAIVGHSERRHYFDETDDVVNRKLKAAIEAGLYPILCIGENLSERESGIAFDIVKRQLTGALQGIERYAIADLIIAYEPVWAIGTGRTATPAQAQEVHKYIRNIVTDIAGSAAADAITIQYGGSVKPDNIRALMQQPDIDGALVGGASLSVEPFVKIVRGASE